MIRHPVIKFVKDLQDWNYQLIVNIRTSKLAHSIQKIWCHPSSSFEISEWKELRDTSCEIT